MGMGSGYSEIENQQSSTTELTDTQKLAKVAREAMIAQINAMSDEAAIEFRQEFFAPEQNIN
jgi:hypothetical protein